MKLPRFLEVSVFLLQVHRGAGGPGPAEGEGGVSSAPLPRLAKGEETQAGSSVETACSTSSETRCCCEPRAP